MTRGADPLDSRRRFTERVRDYVRYRPSYPETLIDSLFGAVGEAHEIEIADIGSGSGIFTRLLLERGAKVFGVEPNTAMRAAAESELSAEDRFVSIDGEAEKTGLDAESVDLVTAAQAFHWFNNARTLTEFARILRPGGQLALIWNRRRLEEPFQHAYDALLREFCADYESVNHQRLDDRDFNDCFESGRMRISNFENHQLLELDGLLGRLKSASYCPPENSPTWAALRAELEHLFAQHARAGVLEFAYESRLYLGPIAR
jgi:SAM-dependent methyltransferase